MLWKNEIVTLINEHRTKPPYSRYDLLIMVENIDYWIDYINEKWSLLVKKDRKGVNMPTLQKEVEVTQLWFDFCNNLPNIWIKKGYSLEEVAEKVGMRSHCLSRIAAGKDLFNVNTLIILADALDMRVEFVPNELK
ncbi:MAG: helix-turn-helix transcriptional regulator [Prevotellaceae bacterium]|jgi:DNA-binding Xre family transcriptional regulator|nr:helix-turn-helix transcriptional regulator [Prevotellaceae bacterium]